MKRAIFKLISLALCILLVLSVTACKNSEPQAPVAPPIDNTASEVITDPAPGDVSDPAASSADEPQPPTDPVPDDDASPVIKAFETWNEHFAVFDNMLTFGNDELEDYVMWCDTEMTDFYIINIYYDESGWITDGKHLFDAETVPVGTAINYMRMVPEGFPTDAVVYTAKGQTYMYAVGYNGRDGGISFMEIDKLIVDPDYTPPSFDETPTTDYEEVLIEVYWVSDDLEIFSLEYTIESASKWHVWKAVKAQNKQIPSKCSLISGNRVIGRNGVMELDFSSEFMEIGNSMTGRTTLQAIANTYISAYDLQAVRFMVEGKYIESAICGYAEEFAYTEC